MPDDILPFDRTRDGAVSRRGFAGVLAGAGATAATAALAADTVETDVVIPMKDGPCEAALITPAGTGPWPGIVVMPDALGLRPAFRGIGKRLAAEGYAVLVPNPYFRVAKAPVLSGPFDFGKPEDRAKLVPLQAGLTNAVKAADGAAWVSFMAGQAAVRKDGKLGVIGFCMGGPYVMLTAAALPDKVGSLVSFHGGGLVTDQPDSPHLGIPKMKAASFLAVADNDDKRQPEVKGVLHDAYAKAGLMAKIEVYTGCLHGWTVSDGMVYQKEGADRAFAEAIVFYKGTLA